MTGLYVNMDYLVVYVSKGDNSSSISSGFAIYISQQCQINGCKQPPSTNWPVIDHLFLFFFFSGLKLYSFLVIGFVAFFPKG